jgi:hypothetical protein
VSDLVGEPECALPSRDYSWPVARASGGIGRRAGFRFLCPKGCGGSSPPSPTKGCRQNSCRSTDKTGSSDSDGVEGAHLTTIEPKTRQFGLPA